MASDVELKGISKRTPDGKEILKNISLAIAPGEFLTLVGPSGCGKSTMLRVISGLTDFTKGSVKIGGRDVTLLPPRSRDLAMVFQSYALYPHMTVAGNIATPLAMSELTALERLPLIGRLFGREKKKSIERRVREAAAQVELTDYLAKKPSQLSGGQRQRVAIARAIVRRPGVFLMDEPLSNLDARLRVHMRSEIAMLHQRLGSTFIYVTHDQVEAMTLSTRIAFMMEGEIVQVGTPHELYEHPNSVRTARFIGSPEINLLPAFADNGVVRLPSGALLPASAHGGITIGIRPQRVSLAAKSPDDLRLRMMAEREEVLGEDVLLYGHLIGFSFPTPFIIRLSEKEAALLRETTHGFANMFTIYADAKKVLLFDAEGNVVPRLARTGLKEAA